MNIGTTVFQLNSDAGKLFDGSTRGVSVLNVTNASSLAGDAGVHFNNGAVELARHTALDNLQSFTIHATINATTIAGSRRDIAEAQTPGIALYIDASGKLVGSVNTAQGWQSVDSGTVLVKEGVATSVQFARDAKGLMTLQINGAQVGSKQAPGPIVNAGTAGFKIGSWIDGKTYPFMGNILNLQIVNGVVTPEVLTARQTTMQQVLAGVKNKVSSSRISVILDPDPSLARLQKLRDILDAAGVTRLSDISTLRLTAPLRMTPNKIVVAPKPFTVKTPWNQVAAEVASGSAATVRTRLAQYLTNRNSLGVVNQLAGIHTTAGTGGAGGAGRVPVSAVGATGVLENPVLHAAAGSVTATTPVAHDTATLTGLHAVTGDGIGAARLAVREPVRITDVFEASGNGLKVLDTTVLDKFTSSKPSQWPVTSAPVWNFITPKTIPEDSAAVIAQTLDLTQTTLQIDPNVTTLYIIAEEVICGPGASITWLMPGGSTPGRLDDPGLNGRGWSGVQTNGSSRDGLAGQSGSAGAPGIDGARGRNAPAIEMWVKTLTAMPNISLNGEDGRPGGQGQRGGSGGNGADGALGHRWWLFGWHCDTQGGDGGDGGNGGPGGPGGRGGNGGNGGAITIGTLQGTLASTVTSKSFLLKNQGGRPGPGGPGGPGGFGGAGGHAGNGETCHDAKDGHNGAQAQPGPQGAAGQSAGSDGLVEFFEFTEADWDELLTRPWISKISPTDAAPGDTLTIFGSAFTVADRIVVDGATFTPTVNADQSISMTIPLAMTGGSKSISVRRQDGTESNRLTLWIKPQLDAFTALLAPNATVTLTGHAFEPGASVLINGQAIPANVISNTSLAFTVPGTGGTGSGGGTVTVQVRNPDGWTSNPRTASKPRILEIPFQWGVNNLQFPSFTNGAPDWGTFEDTFGTAEVWHELLDPIFGHPILTGAFFAFYVYFLKGKGNGGLCTGYCTSLASEVTDDLWTGKMNTHGLTLTDDLRKHLTGVHGKLLSRQSLLHFHDQGRQGIARVEQTAREIEATFLRGCDRNSAPLLFFIPSGDIWDSGYFDKLSDSHCVMPYRFVYPPGHSAPQLSDDGTTTTTSLDGVQLFVWDCNHPESQNCRLEFFMQGGQLTFQYKPDSNTPEFSSSDGITLGEWTNGNYLLGDHDLPFSGPLGLTTFIIDFLLSPADLQVVDDAGNRTGTFGTQIRADIPGSHPCYLAKNMYMLPANTALSRTIVGNGTGNYTFNSIMPDQGSLVIENVPTIPGQQDMISVSSDGTQVRFSAGAEKTFNLTISRQVGTAMRAIAVSGAGAAPGADVDLTVAPDLSLVRLGNQGAARSVEVKAFTIDKAANTPLNKSVSGVALPPQHDLVVAVPDWTQVNLSVQAVSFS